MVAAGLVTGLVFEWLGLLPSTRHAKVKTASVAFTWGPDGISDVACAPRLRLRSSGSFFASAGGPMLPDDGQADGGRDTNGRHDHQGQWPIISGATEQPPQ